MVPHAIHSVDSVPEAVSSRDNRVVRAATPPPESRQETEMGDKYTEMNSLFRLQADRVGPAAIRSRLFPVPVMAAEPAGR
jgi:hypothetical protein